ncbi:MAG: hypothetical protein ACR2LX_01485 [Jatrophihabitans sp.]
MSESHYITNAGWLRQAGRVDAIDDVADQFERPVARGAEAFWSPHAGIRWPRSSRGWRSMARMHSPAVERRAGAG